MVPEHDVAGKNVSVGIPADFAGFDREEVVVAQFVGELEHLVGVITTGIGVGRDGLLKFLLEEGFGISQLGSEKLVVGFLSGPRRFLTLLGKGWLTEWEPMVQRSLWIISWIMA